MEIFFYAHECSFDGCLFLGVGFFVLWGFLFALGFVWFLAVSLVFWLFLLLCFVVSENLLCLLRLGGGDFALLPILLPSMPIRQEGDFLQVLGLSFYFT